MELRHIEFRFERKDKNVVHTGIYVDCCFWLGVMYKYYLKPVITEKMNLLKIIVTEISENKIEEPVSKYTAKGESVYVYMKYDHKYLLGKPFVYVQKTLLNIIHNRIMEYVTENHIERNNFGDAYNSIIENNFIFEKKYLNIVSNGLYTAQMSFKFDFQNTGIFSNDIFVEIFKDNLLFNKIKFFGDALYAIKNILTDKDLEWIDEENIKVYFCGNSNPSRYYWKINIKGGIEYKNIYEDPSDIFHLGIEYYKGFMIAQNKEIGYESIKKAADMGYYYAVEWLRKYKKDSDYPFFIAPKNY